MQRLAVLLWSMEHAEAHNFFQRGWGVVMGTHTRLEQTHDQKGAKKINKIKITLVHACGVHTCSP